MNGLTEYVVIAEMLDEVVELPPSKLKKVIHKLSLLSVDSDTPESLRELFTEALDSLDPQILDIFFGVETAIMSLEQFVEVIENYVAQADAIAEDDSSVDPRAVAEAIVKLKNEANQPITEPMNQPTPQPITEPITEPMNQPTDYPTNQQPTNQQPTNQQPTNQQPTDDSAYSEGFNDSYHAIVSELPAVITFNPAPFIDAIGDGETSDYSVSFDDDAS